MSGEAEERAEKIFYQARELSDPVALEAFLAEACEGDAKLRAEVEAFLRADEKAAAFFDLRMDEGMGPALGELSEGPGTVIGRYKLLEQIGEGGMGVVYMAEQQEPVHRKVALKIIKLGMDTKQVVARFEAERQALALMDHPHIARVLDGGATDTGRPYFVMDLVRGIPITEYCDKQKLTTKERLELFIPACQAVQHAHQKGIIHRDLKPSNVMVTHSDGVPHPMVIDFGVAKATNQKLTEQTLFTNFGQMIGTPAYMAPEQAEMSRLDVDTRSDIYSLGVVLYELLTGTQPFPEQELRSASWAEMQRIITKKEPVKPSTRVTQQRLAQRSGSSGTSELRNPNSEIDKDLDCIVMKCLEKDRTRRYETANGLAADIQRHLANEPVVARPPSRLYEFQKTIRRHKFGFAAAAVLAVMLVAGTSVSTWQALRATRAEKIAENRFRDAEEQRGLAEQATRRARLNQYAADINLAQRVLEESDFGRARELLARHLPANGEPDLRGWEWWYLQGLTQTQEQFILGVHPDTVVEVAYSPDGRCAVSGGLTGTLKIWDPSERRLLGTLHQPGQVWSMVFYSDWTLITSGADRILRIWDIRHLRLLEEIEVDHIFTSLLISASEKCLVGKTHPLSSIQGGVVAWDISPIPVDQMEVLDLKRRFVSRGVVDIPRFAHWTRALAISPDGQTAATGFGDGTIRLLDISTSRTTAQWAAHDEESVANLAFSPDGGQLVSCSVYSEHDAKVWHASSGTLLAKLKGHNSWISGLIFTADGSTLISCSDDQTLRFWSTETWKEIGQMRGHTAGVLTLALSPDEKSVLTGGSDHRVMSWSRHPSPVVPNHVHLPGTYKIFRFAPTRLELAAVITTAPVKHGSVRLWGGPDLSDWLDLPALGNQVRELAYSPDGSSLVAVEEGALKVWDFEGEQVVADVKLPEPTLLQVVGFTADGTKLLLTSADREIQEWDALEWRLLNSWSAQPGSVLIDDGRWIAFDAVRGVAALGGLEGRVSLWNVDDKRYLGELDDGGAFEIHPAFSPDGMVATVGTGEALVWDSQSLQRTSVFAMPPIGGLFVTFAPSGKRLIIGGDSRIAAVILDIATGMELVRLSGESRFVLRLEFSYDRQFLAGSSSEGVLLWRAPGFLRGDTTHETEAPSGQ